MGHAGTLDPLATGLLIIAVGENMKKLDFYLKLPKVYRATILLGESRTTGDMAGDVVESSPVGDISSGQVAKVLSGLVGEIELPVPAYSAIKVDGERLYGKARRNEEFTPPIRKMLVFQATLEDIEKRGDTMLIRVVFNVGSGTYIRSLARDLALALGTLGHIAELRRLSVGRFTEAQAISLDCAVALGHSLAASEHLLPIETALDDIPALALSAAEAARLRHGQRVTPREACLDGIDEGTVVGAQHDRRLVALARVEHGALRPVRVINR